MSNQDHKEPVAKPDVDRVSDSAAVPVKSIKPLFSMDLLAKHDARRSKGISDLPSMTIVHADGKFESSDNRAPVKHPLSSVLAPWTPAEGKIAEAPQKQVHQFKPFKLPNGQIENTGYVPDTPYQIEQLTGSKLGLWQPEGSEVHAPISAAGSHRDAVAPAVQQVGDSAPPAKPDQIIINSGAGSRAQFFNRGPRIEQTVTVPPLAAPAEVPSPTPSAPSADTPQPHPYDGPGSRARFFREQPRN